MKITVLFLTLLSLTHLIVAQKAFDSVKNLLTNFKSGIVTEQHDADVRKEKDDKECDKKISDATAKVNARQTDVDDLTKHITWLNNEKSEAEKDKATREQRLVANDKLLFDFKKQRCDNNLLFVKQLREHMEAIDILTLLRGDINDYFAQKKEGGKVNTAFIERFAEFSHLLSDEHRQVFIALSQSVQNLPDVNALGSRVDASTATAQRTTDAVGTQHVDNTQGELQKLDHVAHVEAGVYHDALHKRVIEMIDGLVQHLKDSRNELTKNEIQAAEDFAVFQTNMEKENDHLREKITELTKLIADLTNQINVAEAQLVKRKKLLDDAQHELEVVSRMCDEKKEYFERETQRRNGELVVVANATSIFDDILAKLSQRVQERANQAAAGNAVTGNLSANVVKQEPAQTTSLNANVAARNTVVFF
jgi:chromosome segregation ATPase